MPIFGHNSAFNKEKIYWGYFKSVLEQNFTDFEILIVNDGSTDNSEKNNCSI
jgi:glycosyltransferase involved in cell wall biosynthesis